MKTKIILFFALSLTSYAANLIAKANTGFTTASTWGVVEAGASATQTTKTSSTNTTTSYVYSPAFTCTNTDVIDGMLLYANRINTTGTVSVALSDDNGVTATRSVTINASDIPTDATWIFFKFGSTLTCDGGVDYKVGILGSSAGNATFYRDGTASNWARLLRTTATQTPVAADNLYIAGEWTAAATVTARTVTMDETATTIYGLLDIGLSGTLSYGTSASTNYYLKLGNDMNVWAGGTFNMGTSGTPIPSTSTAKLQFNSASISQFGLIVNNQATYNAYGASKTTSALLAANASAGATTITSDVSTGWLNGDEIGIAPTTRTAGDAEKKTMSGNATGTSIPIAALTNAHSGTSPTQGELINLTRNVQVFGASVSNTSYVSIQSTAIVNLSYAEFYWLGSNGVGGRSGVSPFITTGTFIADRCSFHDYVTGSNGSIGIYVPQLSSGTLTVTNNVFYSHGDYAFQILTTTNTSWSFTGNIAIKTSNTGRGVYGFSDLGGTVTNNVASGGAGSSPGFSLADVTVNATYGTFSNNTAHSNGDIGFSIGFNPQTTFTMSNTTTWRNGSHGIYGGSFIMTSPLILDTVVAFGNSGTGCNIQFDSYGGYFKFNNLTVNGDTTFSTATGLLFNSQPASVAIMNNSSFGVVSGIKTGHTTADIRINGVGSAIITGGNVTLASGTPVNISTNASPYTYIGFDKYGGVAGANQNFYAIGSLLVVTSTDTAIFKTASPSQRIVPPTASMKSTSSKKTVAVSSGASVTFSVWVRKSVSTDPSGANYNGNQPRLMVQANAACGIGTGVTDVVLATASAALGTWELLSGTTSATTADCTLIAYVDLDGTTGWVNVDDWAVTNAQPTGAEKFWTNGSTQLTLPGTGGSATVGYPIFQ